MKKLEQALKHLQAHRQTGNYMDLYAGLKLVIEANKLEPETVDPLARAISFTILEPLYLEVERHLQPETPKEESPEPSNEKLAQVIRVNFVTKKRLSDPERKAA